MSGIETDHVPDITLRQGSEEYIRYCAGLAIIQFPDEMSNVHRRDVVDDTTADVLHTAETIMTTATKRLMRLAAFEPADNIDLRRAESSFAKVYPNMEDMVSFACIFKRDRLDELNPSYKILRPAAFMVETIYRRICHGKYRNITTLDLLDGFAPDERFAGLVAKRHPFSAKRTDAT